MKQYLVVGLLINKAKHLKQFTLTLHLKCIGSDLVRVVGVGATAVRNKEVILFEDSRFDFFQHSREDDVVIKARWRMGGKWSVAALVV